MIAWELALVLLGVVVGFVVGCAFGIAETRREYEQRIRTIRRYLTKDRVS